MKEYTEQEINELVADIQKTFNSDVAELIKSEASMVSDENRAAGTGAPATAESAPKMVNDENAESSVAAKAEGSMSCGEASMSKDEVAPEGDKSAPPKDESAPKEEAAAPEAAPQEEAPAEDPNAQVAPEQDLHGAYAQLSDEDLHAHYEAIKAVVMARMAGAGGDMSQPAPAAPPQAAAPAPAPAAAPAAQPMAMSEAKVEFEKLTKAQEEKIEDLEKQLEGVAQLFEKILTSPQQKSVTTLAQFQAVTKSEPAKKPVTSFSKAEINKKLNEVTLNKSTKESDRDLVNKYFFGSVKLEDLAHLLQ